MSRLSLQGLDLLSNWVFRAAEFQALLADRLAHALAGTSGRRHERDVSGFESAFAEQRTQE